MINSDVQEYSAHFSPQAVNTASILRAQRLPLESGVCFYKALYFVWGLSTLRANSLAVSVASWEEAEVAVHNTANNIPTM